MRPAGDRCPGGVELGRGATVGPDPWLVAHLDRCSSCRAEWDSVQYVKAMARGVPPVAPMTATARERSRAAVLAGTELRASWRGWVRRVWWLPAAVAAGTLLLLVGRRNATPPPVAWRAVTTARSPVVYAHSRLPDEVVRLRDGRMGLEVFPLGRHERFRLVTGDAEVEVHGTAFDVEVVSDRLRSVEVRHGLVEVRLTGHRPALVRAGEQWEAPPLVRVAPGIPAAPPEVAAPATKSAPVVDGERPVHLSGRVRVAAVVPAAISRHPAEDAFQRAWVALKDGDTLRAAGEFERAERAAEGGPLAEDAAFWRAVALSRAGRGDEAAAAFTTFIERRPASPRLGEASVMLGWLLFHAGATETAKARFEAASGDRVLDVRRSAQDGLKAIADGKRRAP